MGKFKKRYIITTIVLASVVSLCLVRWHAWFDMPAEPEWIGPTSEYTFPAFEQDTTPSRLDILVLGDIHSRLTTEDYNTLADRVPQTDLVLQTGDWMDWGQNYYYQSLIKEWCASRLNGLPVIACPGNHEYSKGLFKKRSEFWDRAFTFPANGPKGVPGATYYIDLPAIRLIVIDTNPIWRMVHLTRTLTWLHQTMKDAENKYVVVLMHHPVISAARGRFNPLIFATFRHALGKADLVLAGHDHSYMRRTPFVVLNTAGKTKRQKRLSFAQAADTAAVYGVLTVENPISSTSELQFKVYRLSDGTLLDSLYVEYH